MATFTVTHRAHAPLCFLVLGPDGSPAGGINNFLAYLRDRGRSGYTLRAYAVGLAHFFTWMHAAGIHPDSVTRQTVEHYIGAFGRGSKDGACPGDPQRAGQVNPLTRKTYPGTQRKASAINHRLSVLASFYT